MSARGAATTSSSRARRRAPCACSGPCARQLRHFSVRGQVARLSQLCPCVHKGTRCYSSTLMRAARVQGRVQRAQRAPRRPPLPPRRALRQRVPRRCVLALGARRARGAGARAAGLPGHPGGRSGVRLLSERRRARAVRGRRRHSCRGACVRAQARASRNRNPYTQAPTQAGNGAGVQLAEVLQRSASQEAMAAQGRSGRTAGAKAAAVAPSDHDDGN
jgi:hypothetical protein